MTEPTWNEAPLDPAERQLSRELELLISGALVFALLQLPGRIDAWWNDTQLHLSGAAFAVPFALYYVGKLASYGLVATILVHFLLRGLWVALLGLRGAFPGGIDESKNHQGPFLRRFYSGRLPALRELEVRVDRIAATIFSFVFLFLTLLLAISLLAFIAGAIAFLAARISGRPSLLPSVFWGLFGLAVVVQLLVAAIDRYSKTHELSPGTERLASAAMRVVYYATLNFLYAPVFLIFSTRVSRRAISLFQVSFLYALIAIFSVSTLASAGLFGFDSYAWFPPNAGSGQIRASHYESLRDASWRASVPSIQSPVVADPYVQLFVPYDVRRDNQQIRRLCPDVPPFRPEGFFTRSRQRTDPALTAAALRCFDKVYTIELDGKALARPEASFFVHPESGLHGRLLMIDARPLAAGRHEIVVRRQTADASEQQRGEFFIPFWK